MKFYILPEKNGMVEKKLSTMFKHWEQQPTAEY